MAGTLTVSTLSDGTNSGSATDAIKGSAKAWVSFKGTGTVTIHRSHNVSSITDNGTGKYSINFTSSFSDNKYVAIMDTALENFNGDINQTHRIYDIDAGNFKVSGGYSSNIYYDFEHVYGVVFDS
jgi:hypothetical protein